MKKILAPLLAGCMLIGTTNLVFADSTEETPSLQSKYVNAKNNLQLTMNTLWDDNLKYTHDYITNLLADLSEKADVAKKELIKTQDKIGDALKPYYGDTAGAKLSILLHEQIEIAKDVANATKAKNDELLRETEKKWDKNAEDVSVFLSDINSYWSKTDLTDMLSKYLKTMKDEIAAIVNKGQKNTISYYNESRIYILKFADTLTKGIEKQFPDKTK